MNWKLECTKDRKILHLFTFHRQNLLSQIARRDGFRKVLVGVNATKLAVRLLSNVAQGRGATLPFDVVSVFENLATK